jgi:tRNA threonylcarbamoyladenosine biosynthesis protein TsaE
MSRRVSDCRQREPLAHADTRRSRVRWYDEKGELMFFVTHDADETVLLGTCLGALVEAGSCIVLDGDLGAGKTQLTKGIASGLGSRALVTSPTFTIINEYLDGRLPLYHLDLYRLEDSDELADIGYDDLFDGSGVIVIEWGERFPDMLPGDALHLSFSLVSETCRTIEASPTGAESALLLSRLVSSLEDAGIEVRA